MFRRFLIFLFTILSIPLISKGDHLVGGEIYYECLGNDNYQITLKVYRDCNSSGAPFDSPASIAIYTSNGGLFTTLDAFHGGAQLLPVIINNPCLQAPPNVCVEEAVYTVTVNLPFIAGGYHVAYQRCCRNQSIVNLTNPASQGSTYYVAIPEAALNSCNSSPHFNSFPPLALCIGEELIFNHSATDPDGDQLVYSLCTPYHGGSQANPAPIPPLGPPYTNINWGGGYSAMDPLDASPILAIDPVTGQLTGVPTQAGQYVVGVCVEEYRNGQLLSINKRDFQFNVVNCASNVEAVIPIQTSFHDPCSGLGVTFGNNSINTQYYHWDFGVANITTDTSNIHNPTYLFPDTGAYSVTLIGNPGYACADTAVAIIEVYEEIVVDITSSGNPCADANNFRFEANGQFGGGSTFLWEFSNATPATSTDRNPIGIVFDSLGVYSVTVTVTENSCSGEATSTIETLPRPQAFFPLDTLIGCAPLGVLLVDNSTSATDYEISWNLGDGSTDVGSHILHEYTTTGSFDISLTIWTNEGCVDTSTYTLRQIVETFPIPNGELTVDTNFHYIFEPTFNFEGTSTDAVECSLATGDGTIFSGNVPMCAYEYTYLDTGRYDAVMTFTDANGCETKDSVLIRVEPEIRFYIPNAFTPNGDRINDTWGPKAYGFRVYELWVFDRWGKQMFHSTDPFEKWDGTLNNEGNHEPVPAVYSYRISAVAIRDLIIKESGHVIILK
ncbi:MAG: gliding motility-associated C-terminal domain-containing protein [Flavobacteriales bacterium]|nr:gliding motility-associated C-terminal domain-containing protein [Flavobacteriales bacterium]